MVRHHAAAYECGEVRSTGMVALDLEKCRDGRLFVPASCDAHEPSPLLVMLHGAGASGVNILGLIKDQAEQYGAIVLAPDSRKVSWDIIADEGFGADVAFIDRALEHTFSRYRIDANRIAVGGFSDGASYALSLGIMNGELFRYVLAFSPGFVVAATPVGKPRLFISHGVADIVLPIDSCSRQLVPLLKLAGYDVAYHEFDGPHLVPASIADRAFDWFTRVSAC
jgi:phospholipase/carboxylesterase